MKDYSKGKIYKIVCNNTGLVYIGSTCEPTLVRRLAKHVGNYKGYKKGKYNYTTSFRIIEGGNYDIVLIEEIPCETKDQLHARERYYIELNQCVNKIIPTRTQLECYQQNLNNIKDKKHEYYESHKEHKLEYNKSYYLANRTKALDEKKQYREINKDIINEKRKIKYICICGSEILYCTKARHERSELHQNYINSKN